MTKGRVLATAVIFAVSVVSSGSQLGAPTGELQEKAQALADLAVKEGLQGALQFCAFKDGKCIVDVWAGTMATNAGAAKIDGNTLFPIFSTEKPLLATAVHRSVEQGKLEYDKPVSVYWPQFRGGGKESLTVRELLGYRSGLPDCKPGVEWGDVSEMADWKGMLDWYASCEPELEPGTRQRYMPRSYGWALGGLLEKTWGRPANDILREQVLVPAGIENDFYFVCGDKEIGRIATVYNGKTFETMNGDVARRSLLPSAWAVSSARGIAKFYNRLCGFDGEPPLVAKATLDEALTPCRHESDPVPDAEGLKKWHMIFGMGYGLWGEADDISRVFGHGGVGGSEGLCDRSQRLVVGYTCNFDNAPPKLREAFYSLVGIRWRYWKDDVNIQDLQMSTTPEGGVEKWRLFERRLGMFVHWGIYSVGEWHEQEFWRKGMRRADYEKFAGRFTAEKFDADALVDVAKLAGAEYIVFTSKHHDGFCMWDTATTDYKVTNTPAKRDVIGELADACHRKSVKLGFYYSNPDWHHPNAHNEKSTHQIPLEPGDVPDMEKYRTYVKAQVTELLTNYGEIVCFFWDIASQIDCPEMDALVRRLQPGIMVNDRGWGNKATCDYSTPERDYEWDLANGRHVEACDAVGVQSWGYRRDEDYHTVGYLTRNIDRYLSTGANFLLNVGPKADGTIPDEARALMADVGKWYGKVRDSFRDVKTVTDLKLAIAPNAVVTRRDDTLFVHFPSGLDATGLDLRPLTVMPERATLLNTGKALNARVEFMPWNVGDFNRETLHVWGIPADELANECIVLRLDFAPDVLDAK